MKKGGLSNVAHNQLAVLDFEVTLDFRFASDCLLTLGNLLEPRRI